MSEFGKICLHFEMPRSDDMEIGISAKYNRKLSQQSCAVAGIHRKVCHRKSTKTKLDSYYLKSGKGTKNKIK